MSIWTIFCPFTPRNNSEKKSVSGSWTLPLVIFDKKVLFFPKIALLKVYMGNTFQKVPFFEDSGCCPKILDTILCSPLTNLKNEKKPWRYHHHFTQMYQRSWSYATLFLRYNAWWMVIFVFHFELFFSLWSPPPLTTQTIKIKKKTEKETWRYRFTHVHQKQWNLKKH